MEPDAAPDAAGGAADAAPDATLGAAAEDALAAAKGPKSSTEKSSTDSASTDTVSAGFGEFTATLREPRGTALRYERPRRRGSGNVSEELLRLPTAPLLVAVGPSLGAA